MKRSGVMSSGERLPTTLQRLWEKADPADRRLIETLADQFDALDERARNAEEERDRLLDRVRNKRAMLRAVIDQMPAGVIVVDAPSGELILSNEKADQILRHHPFPAEAACDLFGQLGFHPDGQPYTPEEWPLSRSIAQRESVASEEIAFTRPDGTAGFLEVSSAPVTCAGGAPRFGVAVISDITGRKLAEEAILERDEQLRNLIEKSMDGILFTDEAGRITTWNMGMELITGLKARDVLGEPAWEIQSRVVNEEWARSDQRARYRALWERVLQDGTYPHLNRLLDVQIRTPQGGVRHVQQNVFVTPTQRGFCVGSIQRDITCRRQVEEALLRHAETLARLNEDLEHAQREANLYLDILTHDIGNTENVSNLYADLLIESLDGEAAERAKKLQRSIRKGIEILKTVSTVRRIHRTNPECRPVDLNAAVQGAIGDFPGSIVLCNGANHPVFADDLLPILFTNLIGNAVKHGGPGVEVAVRVEEQNGEVLVTVEDTGPGVPDDEKSEIFCRYEQKKRGVGEGLGLYLARILVERYGGRIWVEDRVCGRPEEGAAFRFTLQKAAPQG
ncbi:PAS domain S-box protein [Methanoculleus sp. FWC-SCC1]|uniref:histidine kinase n=1 Tax=Methanoculleus frigidifontis TaxID=2584085 RepID=A0ABT8M828_9EURY|nr:PAS domain S-box protein [Methanoculleus sp. FWC-SCC1]MDN7024084.1 PAS domain S-box protein [Methanoculleus sp. FWC-SCC1]